MNEQLQNTINTILQNAVEAAAKGAEFLKGEIPEVVQQLLTWKLVSSSIGAGVSAAILCIFGTIMYRWWKSYLARGYGTSDSEDFCIVFISVAVAITSVPIFIFGVICNAMQALQIWLAPKVWLLEYAASLIKGN